MIKATPPPILLTTSETQIASVIYVEDRGQILRWKIIGASIGYVGPDVGRWSEAHSRRRSRSRRI